MKPKELKEIKGFISFTLLLSKIICEFVMLMLIAFLSSFPTIVIWLFNKKYFKKTQPLKFMNELINVFFKEEDL